MYQCRVPGVALAPLSLFLPRFGELFRPAECTLQLGAYHPPAHMPSNVSTLPTTTALLARFVEQADAGRSLAKSAYTATYRGLRTRASFGMGAPAHVPWLSFLGSSSMRLSDSWYPVVLYFRRAGALVVAYGIGEACPRQTAWEGKVTASAVAELLPSLFHHAPERYGSSLVSAMFSAASGLDFEQVAASVDHVIDLYLELRTSGQDAVPERTRA